MEDEKKDWLLKIFEDKNLKLKHFKILVFIFTQVPFNHYKKIDDLDLINVCDIKSKKTLIKILNYFTKKGYIDLEIKNSDFYICLKNNPIEITQKSKITINLENLKNRENFLIEELFNPFHIWGNIPFQKRIEIINSYTEDEIKQILNNKKYHLHYDLFLLTPYWETIKYIVKQNHKFCQKCGSKHKLHIHHLSYEHHYYEHLFLNDLIVLCEKCHKKEHKKI